MSQFINTRLLALVCFVMSIGILASCEKDEDANSGIVELLSFGPTGANHGDTLRFFGSNLDKVTAIEFTGNNATVQKADFKKHTDKEILLLVPEAAEKGYVKLKTPQGDVTSKTQLNLGVTAVISSITDEARPGANITINGSYLNWIERITFTDNKVVENFVSQSFNQLVVTVPEDAQTGPLLIWYGGTDSMEVETADTVVVTLPKAVSFSPNPIKHAENVTITGTDIDLVRKVYFTGVSAAVTTFVSQTATQLVVKVPGGATDGTIKLEAASGEQTTSTASLNLVWPSVTTMAPNPVDPGANLTVTGTNLDLVNSITFENADAVTTFVSQTPTQIVVAVPMGVTMGKIKLGIINSSVTVLSNDILEITGAVPPPTISFPIYNDAVTSNWTGNGGWVGGGWGGTVDYNNASPIREGSKSVRVNYVGGWGAPLQLGGATVPIGAHTTFKISIYGGAGTHGKKVNLGINGADGPTITLVEGEWTDYAFPISTLTAGTTITDIIVKEFNGTGGFTIYVDAIGLN